mmetsp:Transcript_10809/g.23059  ORF Transcript_10809/g.23059 Transcript_10809/m.23059 type:complete len:99 (+) Transcript_10809:252-548(+)
MEGGNLGRNKPRSPKASDTVRVDGVPSMNVGTLAGAACHRCNCCQTSVRKKTPTKIQQQPLTAGICESGETARRGTAAGETISQSERDQTRPVAERIA